MIVYNISIQIDSHIEKEWLAWEQEEHIPEIMSTGLFNEYRVFKLLDHDHEENSTYIIQYSTDTREKYDKYVLLYVKDLQQKASEKWGNSFVAFRTLMQEVIK